jgi:hypothetical protein
MLRAMGPQKYPRRPVNGRLGMLDRYKSFPQTPVDSRDRRVITHGHKWIYYGTERYMWERCELRDSISCLLLCLLQVGNRTRWYNLIHSRKQTGKTRIHEHYHPLKATKARARSKRDYEMKVLRAPWKAPSGDSRLCCGQGECLDHAHALCC